MKRIPITLFILTINLTLLFASYKVETTKPFSIQAGYDKVTEFEIRRIPAQKDEEFRLGIPFNIEDPRVLFPISSASSGGIDVYGAGSGRIIAEWNFISNTNFSIKIEAEPLKFIPNEDQHPITGQENKDIELQYSLGFAFDLSYWTADGENISTQAYIIYNGENEKTYIWNYATQEVFPKSESDFVDSEGYVNLACITRDNATDSSDFLGSSTGKIYIGFTKETSDIIREKVTVPDGNYSGNVTLLYKVL